MKKLRKFLFFLFVLLFLGLLCHIAPYFFFSNIREIKKDKIVLQHGSSLYILEYPFLKIQIKDMDDFLRIKGIEYNWRSFDFHFPYIIFPAKYKNKLFLYFYHLNKNNFSFFNIETQEIYPLNKIPSIFSISPSKKFILWALKDEKENDLIFLYRISFSSQQKISMELIKKIEKIKEDTIKICGSPKWDIDEKILFIPIAFPKKYKNVIIGMEYKIVKIIPYTGNTTIFTSGNIIAVCNDKIVVVEKDTCTLDKIRIKIIEKINEKEKIINIEDIFSDVNGICCSNSGRGLYLIGENKNSAFYGLWYLSFDTQVFYIVKKRLSLYWGGIKDIYCNFLCNSYKVQ